MGVLDRRVDHLPVVRLVEEGRVEEVDRRVVYQNTILDKIKIFVSRDCIVMVEFVPLTEIFVTVWKEREELQVLNAPSLIAVANVIKVMNVPSTER